MMGRQAGDQSQLFYLFNLEERIPVSHLLRRMMSLKKSAMRRVEALYWGLWRSVLTSALVDGPGNVGPSTTDATDAYAGQ